MRRRITFLNLSGFWTRIIAPCPPRAARCNDARFIVRDRNGQALGYFYFEDESGRPARVPI